MKAYQWRKPKWRSNESNIWRRNNLIKVMKMSKMTNENEEMTKRRKKESNGICGEESIANESLVVLIVSIMAVICIMTAA